MVTVPEECGNLSQAALPLFGLTDVKKEEGTWYTSRPEQGKSSCSVSCCKTKTLISQQVLSLPLCSFLASGVVSDSCAWFDAAPGLSKVCRPREDDGSGSTEAPCLC